MVPVKCLFRISLALVLGWGSASGLDSGNRMSCSITGKGTNPEYNRSPVPEKGAANSGAATKFVLTGTVTDKASGIPIPDANIVIPGTPFGAASGNGGFYFINGMPEGFYDISVQVMGYHSLCRKQVAISENTVQDFQLEQTVIPLNPLIVTATRSEHLRQNISVSSEILSGMDLKERNGSTAGEIVESTTGLFVKDNGSFAGLKTLSIRGSDDSQVLILLDGVRMNSAQFAGFDINLIPADLLERVEIIRGGHSALYGADALGGAVHFITRESAPPRGYSFGIRQMIGTYGAQSTHLHASQRFGPVQAYLMFNQIRSSGHFTYTDANGKEAARQNNDYLGNYFLVKLQTRVGRNSRLKIMHHYQEAGRGVPGDTFWPSAAARRKENRHLTSIQLGHQVSQRVFLKINTYRHALEHRYSDPGAWMPVNSRHVSQALGADIQSHLTLSEKAGLDIGGEYRHDMLESTDLGRKIRDTQSAFIQMELCPVLFLFGQSLTWKWIPALRWDRYRDFASQISPKLGTVLQTGGSRLWSFRSNIGRSFRAPSFNDLYWPEDDFARGNPWLGPETGLNMDAGLSFQNLVPIPAEVEVTFFSNRIQNLISWQPGADWKWSPVNIGQARIQGIESAFTVHTPGHGAHITVAHTLMKTEDLTRSPSGGNALIYRPDAKTDLIAGFTLHSFQVNIDYRIVGKRYTTSDNSVSLPGYRILNANAALTFRAGFSNLEARIMVQNLLDRSITILEGYPVPGREMRFTLGMTID